MKVYRDDKESKRPHLITWYVTTGNRDNQRAKKTIRLIFEHWGEGFEDDEPLLRPELTISRPKYENVDKMWPDVKTLKVSKEEVISHIEAAQMYHAEMADSLWEFLVELEEDNEDINQ